MREAVVAHAGEARAECHAFEELDPRNQEALLRFLETLQVLPPGTKDSIVDERHQPRPWPPMSLDGR